MARPKGVEPLASSTGSWRSIQLSYGRIQILSSRFTLETQDGNASIVLQQGEYYDS